MHVAVFKTGLYFMLVPVICLTAVPRWIQRLK